METSGRASQERVIKEKRTERELSLRDELRSADNPEASPEMEIEVPRWKSGRARERVDTVSFP